MDRTKPRFSYWVIAVLGLFWNLMGCLNYITQTNAEAVAQMPESYQQAIADRPAWATAAFAIAVFGGAVGCILLLLRRRVAVQALTVSAVGVAVTLAQVVVTDDVRSDVLIATSASLIVAVVLVWIARLAAGKAWLR